MFSILRLLIFTCCIQASYAQKIFSTSYANQADIKVFVVKYPNQADLKVYKVAYSNQAKGNEGNWYFVNYSNQSDKKVYFCRNKLTLEEIKLLL